MGYRELHKTQTCTAHSKGLEDFSNANIKDFNLLGDNTARNNKFHCLIIHVMNLVRVQPHPKVFKVATTMKIDSRLQGSWGILSMYTKVSPKAA